jgi:hypothetical protein
VSYLHEWTSTAMFELGTVGSVLANSMVERNRDVDIFLKLRPLQPIAIWLILIYRVTVQIVGRAPTFYRLYTMMLVKEIKVPVLSYYKVVADQLLFNIVEDRHVNTRVCIYLRDLNSVYKRHVQSPYTSLLPNSFRINTLDKYPNGFSIDLWSIRSYVSYLLYWIS